MPEKGLNNPDICPMLNQVGGKGVTKRMWPHGFGNARLLSEVLQSAKDPHATYGLAPLIEENMGFKTTNGGCMHPYFLHIAVERGQCGGVYGHQAFFVALANHPNQAIMLEYIPQFEGNQFGHPQTTGIQHLDHGDIPLARRQTPVHSSQQSIHLIDGKVNR